MSAALPEKLVLPATVTYADVDRREVMLLPRLFKLLQEAAILHANQFDTGTHAMLTRGETWVLNRIAVAVERYPRHEERLRVETWSSGIKGFRGLRDFRVFDAEERTIVLGSSVWVYVSLKTKSVVRVPPDVAAGFPSREEVWCPELPSVRFEALGETARAVTVSLRYSDFDVNEHVNNAAYLDLVQTGLAAAGGPLHPRRVQLYYAKAIPAGTEQVQVRVARMGEAARFAIESGGVLFAQGEAQG